MATTLARPSPVVPWHVGVMTVLSLVWSIYPLGDIILSYTVSDPYFLATNMTQSHIDDFHAMPFIQIAFWAIGCVSCPLGAAALALRSKWAIWGFALSLIGYLGVTYSCWFITQTFHVTGWKGFIFTFRVAGASLLFLGYAWAMTKQGILR